MGHGIIDRETTFENQLDEVYARRGNLFYALEAFQKNGLPDGIPSARYLESNEWAKPEKLKCIRSGKMIFALERLFSRACKPYA